jgi:hypothetical protein
MREIDGVEGSTALGSLARDIPKAQAEYVVEPDRWLISSAGKRWR